MMEIDVKAAQQRELEILKAVMEILDRHGLRWWADSGTCLGAVRHGGFIPWDDDIDIGMPREDFDKFRVIAKKELPDWLALQDYEQTRHAVHSILKIHDVRTTFVECGLENYPETYTGVYIDIFAYDGYPAPGPERDALERKRQRFVMLNRFLRGTWADTRTAGEKLRYILFSPTRLFLRYNWASMCQEEMFRRYRFDEQPWANECFGWVLYPSECLKGTVLLPFEDIQIPCPAGTEAYLRALYGDYMQLPPEEQRNPSHPVAWFSMDQSYRTRWWER